MKRTRSRSSAASSLQPKRRQIIRRLLEIATLIVLAIVVVYVTSLAYRVGTGYSVTQETSDHSVRLQVVNGSGEKSVLKSVVTALEARSDKQFDIEVVDTEMFVVRTVEKSFLIDRSGDIESSREVARFIGLDPLDVIEKKLEQNDKFVTVTLVLGTDVHDRILEQTEETEN